MTKSKKKKNYKLRRRVKRTIASIIMIMAVVVAAIPVENLGTTQAAADTEFDMAKEYSKDSSVFNANLYDNSGENNTYDSTKEITIQRIESGALINAYKAYPTADYSYAMISGLADLADITVKEKEYYKYELFDTAFINHLENQYQNTNFEITFDDGDSVTLGGGQYELTDNSQAANASLPAISGVKKLKSDSYRGDAISGSNVQSNNNTTYTVFNANGKTMADIYKNCEQNDLTSKQQEVVAYNEKVDEILAIQRKIDSSTKLTKAEEEEWNSFAADYQADYNNAKTLSKSYNDLSSTNGLKNALAYIICNCYKDSKGKGLSKYILEPKSTSSMGTVYVAKLNDDRKEDGQTLDNDDYLVTGQVTINGIKSNAFENNATINSVVIEAPVKFIGDNAFKDSSLTSIEIDASKCEVIGDNAFENAALQNVTFSNASTGVQLKKIGTRAFKNTKIKSIEIPYSTTEVGPGCFEDCSDLATVEFYEGSSTSDIEIDEYAFYNCRALTSVAFQDNRNITIKKGAFALPKTANGGKEMDFTFPQYNSTIGDSNDYILAGRGNLRSVTFPASLTGKVPDNTLRGCYQLSVATFPDGASSAKYNSTELFHDVVNEEFYVFGPKLTVANTDAEPRKCTWKATAGYLVDGKEAPIPYMYEENGEMHFEIGYKGSDSGNYGDYVATIDVISENNKTARLSKFTTKDGKDKDRIALTISTVGKYTITEIGDNCFDTDAKDKIYKLTLADGAVEKINADAFKGAAKLQYVYIGNAVTDIGSKAFADCGELQNVHFSTVGIRGLDEDDSHWSDLAIADDAFATQSDYLTFHGDINPNYRPFQIAMSEDSEDMTKSDRQICYKTDEPLNLTVIRNRKDGKATLVDYSHYEDMTDTDKKAFEAVYVGENATNATMDSAREAVVRQTLEMQLPNGIESIDSKSFFDDESGNKADYDYINRKYAYENDPDTDDYNTLVSNFERPINSGSGNSDSSTIRKLYSVDKFKDDPSYAASVGDDQVSRGGLFSGYFIEGTSGTIWKGEAYRKHTYVEEYSSGNDYLTSINMRSIESLPDYAFDSNENLLSVSFDAAMQEMGARPFRDCKSTHDIQTGDNAKYTFENMLLYENQGDDTKIDNKIVQCLEGRGRNDVPDINYGSRNINASTNLLLSTVSLMDDYAFADCTNLAEVDLSESQLKKIPEGAFKGATSLQRVVLPKTVSSIEKDAFKDTTDNINVTILNPLCSFTDDAFDFSGQPAITIQGVKYVDEKSGTLSPCYESFERLEKAYGENAIRFSEIGSTYTVRFVDSDLTQIGETQIIEKGNNAVPPADPKRNGYKFAGWVCRVGDQVLTETTEDKAYTNVREDRVIVATYTPDPQAVVPDGNSYSLTVTNGKALIDGEVISTFPVTVEGGTSGLTLMADDQTNFSTWTASPRDYATLIDNPSAYTTNFTMPNADVTVSANSAANSDNNNNNGNDNNNGNNNNNNGDNNNDSSTKYKVTVNYGSGSGEYKAGDTVTISAFAPESASKVFSKWTTNNSGLGFASATSSTTTFVMPAADVTVTANYKTRSSSDDDDDDDSGSSRRPGTNTNTTTVSNRPSNSTATTGTTGTVTSNTTENTTGTSNTNNDGSKIYITKNGVSNKDVASVSVDGSTDNFIVRITESAEATAAVEEALINKYGSLDGLAYFPMDISLYDATGQNKITDTYGLNITVTMPIPDVLIQYGGNARVAAADNGNLQQLTPKFTTIDGIACISFIPPHFSPYVIYVDTNNLVAGQTLDATPSTGDPIHPKWFAAIGMACLSIILFATSDGHKRRKYKAA